MKDKMKMEGRELAMASIHSGGKSNEAFEITREGNEVERADTIYRDPGPNSQRMVGEGRKNGNWDVDLGVGSRFNRANIQGKDSAVNKVTVDVHEIDVGVHGSGRKGPHFNNLGFNEGEVGANSADVDDNEIKELEEELEVQMCDQETQTELSLLDEMDDQAIEQLGLALDESL